MANNNHFNLTLDTTAPVGSDITVVKSPVNGTVQLKFSASDVNAGTPSLMKIWANTSATNTAESGSWIAYANHSSSAYSLALPEGDGTYYAHVIFMDDVGNKSTVKHSSGIVCDRSAPTISAFTITDPSVVSPQSGSAYTNNLINNVSVTFADNEGGVGISSIKFTCSDFAADITATATGTSYSGTIEFKSGTAAGTKTVNAYVYDAAGNVSAVKTATIYYDPNPATAVLELHTTNSYNSVVPANIKDNNKTVYARIDITSASPDVVGYKIWGSLQNKPTEPSSYTSVTSGTDPIDIGAVIFTSGAGVKTVHAKVVDRAGNETTLTDVVVKVDLTGPTLTLTASPTAINASSSSTLTYAVSDPNISSDPVVAGSGIASWNIKINGSSTAIKSGTSAVSSTTVAINKDSAGMQEGSNTITLTATDNAGNTSTKTATVIYDKTGPTVSITSPTGNPWKNAAFGVSVKTSDATTGVDKVYVWSTTSSTKPSTVPSGVSATTVNSNPNTEVTTDVAAASVNFTNQQQGQNYLWAAAVDKQGNTTITATGTQYRFDNVAPTCAFTFSQQAYNSTSANVTVTFSDATSGASVINLSGNITSVTHNITDDEKTAGSATISVALTTGDGEKTVNATVTDVASNTSTTVTHKCELDTSKPSVAVSLYEDNGSTAKASPSNIATFKVKLTFTDDQLTAYGKGSYKIWSNVAITGISARSETAATWQPFDTAGSTSITLGTYTALSAGTQTITVSVKDNAGNVIDTPVAVSWVFDNTAPECGITVNPDFYRISKVDAYRYSGTSVTTKKTNQIIFTFGLVTAEGSTTISGEYYSAYRICAYWDQTRAAAGSWQDSAYIIPTTNGSINMSAGGNGGAGTAKRIGNTAITATINGADYETALKASAPSGTTNWDGAHIVVAYICDDGGNWSVAAEFSA